MNFTLFSCSALGYPPLACFLTNIMVFIDAVLVPLIMALAFITFLWGIFQYFIAGGASEEARETGKQFVMWGLIGFVLMISLWGIINLLTSSLGFRSDTRPPLPTFGTPNNANTTQTGGLPTVVRCTPSSCGPRASCDSGSGVCIRNTTGSGTACTPPDNSPCASGEVCTAVSGQPGTCHAQ